MFGDIGPMQALGAVFAAVFKMASAVEKTASIVDVTAGMALGEVEGAAAQLERDRKERYQHLLGFEDEKPVRVVESA